MAAARGMDPFLEADFPTHAPKRHGQGLLRCALGFPLYDTGGQAPHVMQTEPKKERATAPRLCAPSFSGQPTVRKANRRARGMQPPHC